jgi:hypothetical protein
MVRITTKAVNPIDCGQQSDASRTVLPLERCSSGQAVAAASSTSDSLKLSDIGTIPTDIRTVCIITVAEASL